MSIGKSSIARAVSATGTVKTQGTTFAANTVTSFLINNIGTLAIAKAPDNTEEIKKSIAKRGILCPVLAAVTAKGDVWLLDGYCRYYAAKDLGISQINAIVIAVENKSEANRIYTELSKLKPAEKPDTVYEEKFRVLAVKDHDLPTYLL